MLPLGSQHGCSRTTSSTRRWIIIDGTDSDFWNCHDRHRIPPFLNRCQTGSSSSNRSATSGSCSFNHRLLYLSVPGDGVSSFVHRSLFARHALQVYSSSRRTKLSWFLLSSVSNCQSTFTISPSAINVLTKEFLLPVRGSRSRRRNRSSRTSPWPRVTFRTRIDQYSRR